MEILRLEATDAELIAAADRWAALMELEDYTRAYDFTDHNPHQGWTPDLVGRVVRSYGEAQAGQRVTVAGRPTDITQTKEVMRSDETGVDVGTIWYDLNIDGLVSDLTATFDIVRVTTGLALRLNDIHVM